MALKVAVWYCEVHTVSFVEFLSGFIVNALHGIFHGLRTPNEGINQINLKIWADVADKICFGRI